MYLGIVKEVTNGMIGASTKILTKTAFSKEEIKNWINCYPSCQSIILPYEESKEKEIKDFFDEFEDDSIRSEAEKEEAQRLYKKVMES